MSTWEAKVLNCSKILKGGAGTESFTKIDLWDEVAKGDKVAQLKSLLDIFKANGGKPTSLFSLDAVLRKAAEFQLSAMKKFTDAVTTKLRFDGSTEKSATVWARMIKDSAYAMRTDINANLDTTTTNAIDKINQMPHNAQSSGADIYIMGLAMIQMLYEALWNEAMKVSALAPEFLQGRWGGVGMAFSRVKDSEHAVIGGLQSIFRMSHK
ncbi:hypothetical protein VTL71DRAFT_5642 [Oculimacula yallundae]|uniref:Uncharacterized protein n=1 Tax=Oculimacula yallundae TaxID=86028 RepID=A0ABR4BY82_9HELO